MSKRIAAALTIALGVGMLATAAQARPEMVGVRSAEFSPGTIVIRTGQGTMVEGHADEQVAFEVDHLDEALNQGWSVLVRGLAHRVAHPAELRNVADAGTHSWGNHASGTCGSATHKLSEHHAGVEA